MIPYGKQSIDRADIRAVKRILKGEYLTTGPTVELFEDRISKILGGVSVLAVSSGTAALHCAYVAAGIEAGDEIITPPITFIATQATAALCGAEIVFSDVESDTGNLDPTKIEEKITSKTKAIVVVDYAGHPGNLDELKKICEKHNLLLIEDASHSFGSLYKNRLVGTIADITTFSFFPTKNITTGEGGAVVFLDSNKFDRAKKFARQGLVRDKESFLIEPYGPWHQEVQKFGLNYRLSDIAAALGLSQLNKFDKFKKIRNAIYEQYNEELSEVRGLQLPVKKSYADPFWHLYPLRVPIQIRKNLYEYLHKNNVKVQVNYLPVHLNPVFQGKYSTKDYPESFDFFLKEISLPIYTTLKPKQIRYVSRLIKTYFKSESVMR